MTRRPDDPTQPKPPAPSPAGPPAAAELRQARLAQALRDNLRRRKAAAAVKTPPRGDD